MTRKRPPDVRPPGGLVRVWSLLAACALAASGAGAQVIHGTIRTQQSEAVVPGARVTVADSAGKEVASTLTDAGGHFTVSLKLGKPFTVSVAKIGWLPSSTDLVRAAVGDTLEVDLLVPSDPVAITGVKVEAEANKSFNTRSLEDARRHGWKVYAPDLIDIHRNNATSFTALMQEVGVSGVTIDDRANSSGAFCAKAVRFSVSTGTSRCMTYILDGVPSGTFVYVNPRDVYFFAVLSATESASRWGDKAPWGAIVVYTRMNGDKKTP